MSRQSHPSESTSSTASDEDYATPPEGDDLPEDSSLQGAVGGVPHPSFQAPPPVAAASPIDDFAGFDATFFPPPYINVQESAETEPKTRYPIPSKVPKLDDSQWYHESLKPPWAPEDRRYAEFKKWNEEQRMKRSTRPNPFLHPMDYRKWRKQYRPKPIAGPSLTDVTSGQKTRGVSTQTDVTFPPGEFPSDALTRSQGRYEWKFKPQGTPEPTPSKFGRLREQFKEIKRRVRPGRRVESKDEEVIEETGVGTQTDMEMPSTQQRIPKQFRYVSDQKRQRVSEKVHKIEMKALDAQRKADEVQHLINNMKKISAITADFVKSVNLQRCEERLQKVKETLDAALLIVDSLREKRVDTKREKRDVENALKQAKVLVDQAVKETTVAEYNRRCVRDNRIQNIRKN